MTPEHMTILTVDDTPANIRLLTHYLHKQGYKVITAEDGFEGFKAAIQYRPDLILLDVMMPGTDGYEVCELLKTEEETRDIPVVFLTAKAEVEDRIRGFEMGAVDYITKPFNLTEIATRVKTQLQLQYLKHQNDRLFNMMKESARHMSLGIIADDLFQRVNADIQSNLGDKEISKNKVINSVLNDVARTSKLAENYRTTLGQIASDAEMKPLYQLFDDTVDLVRRKHTGLLPIDCEKPDSDVMVNVHSGLAMHAIAEIMVFAAGRALQLDALELNTSEQELVENGSVFRQIYVIARGDINNEIPDIESDDLLSSLNGNIASYSLAAAVTSVRCLGGKVIFDNDEKKSLKISITLPALKPF